MKHLSFFLLLPFAVQSHRIESISATSKEDRFIVKEGEDALLSCTTDLEYFTCSWSHTQSNRKCTRLNENGNTENCMEDRDAKWTMTEAQTNQCSLLLTGVGLSEDAGEYKCTAIFIDDQGELHTDSGVVTLQIASPPSSLELGSDGVFLAGEETSVSCTASDFFPRPILTLAFEGGQVLEAYDETEDENTFTAHFNVNLSPEDRGRKIVCRSKQFDEKKRILYAEESQPQEIDVMFAPLDYSIATEDFSTEDRVKVLSVEVIANPPPSKAFWTVTHVENETILATIPVKTREDFDDEAVKYSALPFNMTPSGQVATLIVNDLKEEDSGNAYTLTVENGVGTTVYNHYLSFIQDIFEEELIEVEEEVKKEVEKSGVSTEMLIIICIVSSIVGLAIISVVICRQKRLLCFERSYDNENERKEDDEGDATTKPIIKKQKLVFCDDEKPEADKKVNLPV